MKSVSFNVGFQFCVKLIRTNYFKTQRTFMLGKTTSTVISLLESHLEKYDSHESQTPYLFKARIRVRIN